MPSSTHRPSARPESAAPLRCLIRSRPVNGHRVRGGGGNVPLIEIEGDKFHVIGAKGRSLVMVVASNSATSAASAQTHLACACPASRHHLFEQSQFPVRGGGGGVEERRRKRRGETLSKQVTDSVLEADNLVLSPPEPAMLISAFIFNRQGPLGEGGINNSRAVRPGPDESIIHPGLRVCRHGDGR